MNISKFIKENIPLCVCTLGLAIVSYMGYHAVRWIINKCQKTEKIDQVAQKHLKSPHIAIEPETKPSTAVSTEQPSEKVFSAHLEKPSSEGKKKCQKKLEVVQEPFVSSEQNSPTGIAEPSKTPKSLINRVSNLDITEGKVNTGQGEYIVFHNLSSGEKKEVAGDTYEQVYEILNEYAPASSVNRNSDSAMEECDNRYEIIKSKGLSVSLSPPGSDTDTLSALNLPAGERQSPPA